MQETQVHSQGLEDSLEKGMTTHSRALAWRIPWTELADYSPWGHKRSDRTEQLAHRGKLHTAKDEEVQRQSRKEWDFIGFTSTAAGLQDNNRYRQKSYNTETLPEEGSSRKPKGRRRKQGHKRNRTALAVELQPSPNSTRLPARRTHILPPEVYVPVSFSQDDARSFQRPSQKLTRHTQSKKSKSEKTRLWHEALESASEFNIAMNNMERALMGKKKKKTDKRWEQMGKVNWETETLKTNQKEILEIKTIVIEGKGACYGFMSIYDWCKNLSGPWWINGNSSNSNTREKIVKKKNRTSENYGTISKDIVYA